MDPRFGICLTFSLTVHAALLVPAGLYWSDRERTDAEIVFDRGESVLELTATPSAPAEAAPERKATNQPEDDFITPSQVEEQPRPVRKRDAVAETSPAGDYAAQTDPRVPADMQIKRITGSHEAVREDAAPAFSPTLHANADPAAGTAPANSQAAAGDERAKGSSSPAPYVHVEKPEYPPLSRRRGEEGSVELAIEVRADGSLGAVRVIRSSGYPRLDRAAIRSLSKARLMPAKVDGHPVTSTIVRTFTFRLVD